MSKTKSQLQADIAKFETLINKETTSEGQKKVFRAIQTKAQAKLDAMDKPSEPKAEAKKQAPKRKAPKRKAAAKKEEPKKATPKKKTVAKKKTTKKKTAKKKTTAKKTTAKKSSNRGSFAALRSAIAKRDGISYKAALPIAKKEYAEQKKSITSAKRKKTSTRLDAYKRKYKGRGLEPVEGRALDVQKDAKQQALPRGKRISKGTGANQYGKAKKGKVYYEYRSNRTDIRQPKKGQTLKPPRLARGGEVSNQVKQKIRLLKEYGFYNKVGYGDNIFFNVNKGDTIAVLDKTQDGAVELYERADYYDFIGYSGTSSLERHLQDDYEYFEEEFAKGGILKSEQHGAAYKLDGDTLMYAPLMDSGKYSDDDWAEVDFNRIDVELANAIKKETESLYAQGGELSIIDSYTKKKFKNLSNEQLVDLINTLYQYGKNNDDEVSELVRRRNEQGFKIVAGYDSYSIEYAKGGRFSQDSRIVEDKNLENDFDNAVHYYYPRVHPRSFLKDRGFEEITIPRDKYDARKINFMPDKGLLHYDKSNDRYYYVDYDIGDGMPTMLRELRDTSVINNLKQQGVIKFAKGGEVSDKRQRVAEFIVEMEWDNGKYHEYGEDIGITDDITYEEAIEWELKNNIKTDEDAEEYLDEDNQLSIDGKMGDYYAKGGFIQDAVKDMKKKGTVGAFTAQARKRGLKPVEFAKEVLRSPDEFSETTRKRAQFVKNANPELFNFGGEIVRKYDVNIKSGVGTYAKGGKIDYYKDGEPILNTMEKEKMLKPLDDYGYYLKIGNVIHYYDNNKNWETSKFGFAKGGNVKKKDDLVEILTRVKEEEGESDMYYDLQMKLVAYGDNPDVARKEFMSVLENYDVRPQYYLGEDNEDDYDVMGSFDEQGDLI